MKQKSVRTQVGTITSCHPTLVGNAIYRRHRNERSAFDRQAIENNISGVETARLATAYQTKTDIEGMR